MFEWLCCFRCFRSQDDAKELASRLLSQPGLVFDKSTQILIKKVFPERDIKVEDETVVTNPFDSVSEPACESPEFKPLCTRTDKLLPNARGYFLLNQDVCILDPITTPVKWPEDRVPVAKSGLPSEISHQRRKMNVQDRYLEISVPKSKQQTGIFETISVSLENPYESSCQEDSREEPEEEPTEDSREEPEEEPNEDSREEPNEESREDSREEPNEESREDSREEPEEEPNEDSREEPNEESREDSREEPNEESREDSREEPEEEPNEDSREEPEEEPNEDSREEPGENTLEDIIDYNYITVELGDSVDVDVGDLP